VAESTEGISGANRSPRSVAETLDWLPSKFHRVQIDELRATYQVELSGDGGGVIWARIDAGRLSCGEGRTPRPDVVFQLSAVDFFAVLAAEANPELLYMEDRIRVHGSMSVALKLRAVFLAPDPR
jgi:predicted lipid carrier protein YhbT